MRDDVDREAFHRDGFAVIAGVLPLQETERLRSSLSAAGTPVHRRNGAVFGARNLLAVTAVRQLSTSQRFHNLVAPIIGRSARPVRALFFDKTPDANWPVLWHQDRTIAVSDRQNLDGWGPWTRKAGIVHVEPPEGILRSMVTLRLHLDDCGPDNGPLRVLPGSHRFGRLSRDRIEMLKRDGKEIACIGPAGSAVVIRPLLLHASSAAHHPAHRRVLHLEYAPADVLPQPLAWASAT